MSEIEKKHGKDDDPNVPEWLKVIQINSWEAELLISALLLYMLFQVPEFIENYQGQHYENGEIMYLAFGIFITALKVLRIGYSVHIIARGIWVASVGLSYIYPKSLDPKKLKFKGKFGQEIENDQALDKTIKNLEKVASLSYAVSFMISGMVISVGLLLLYFIMFQEWVLQPSMLSNSSFYKIVSVIFTLFYGMIMVVLFIDFITNGVFRRELWAAKPYYYVAIFFRYLTLSFIYNRIQLTIISNLSKWQARAVPLLAVLSIVGYMLVEDKIIDWDNENYLSDTRVNLNRMNYESMRKKDDPIYVTIQDKIIDDNVVELYVATHGMMTQLYQKDTTYSVRWKQLNQQEQSAYAEKYIKVELDGVDVDSLPWLDFQHPITYNHGFLNFIDVSSHSKGLHTINVALDTANMNDLQKRIINDRDPSFVEMGNVKFYKSN